MNRRGAGATVGLTAALAWAAACGTATVGSGGGVVDACSSLLACCAGLPASVSTTCQKDAVAADPTVCAADLANYASFPGCGGVTQAPVDAGVGSCAALAACCANAPPSMAAGCGTVVASGVDSDCAMLIMGGICGGGPCPGSAVQSARFLASAGCGGPGSVTLTVATAGWGGIAVAAATGVGLPVAGAYVSGSVYSLTSGDWTLTNNALPGTAKETCTASGSDATTALQVVCTTACPSGGDAGACDGSSTCTTTLTPQ